MQRYKIIFRPNYCMYGYDSDEEKDEQNEDLNEVLLQKPNSSQSNDEKTNLNEVLLQKPNSS